MLKRKYTIENRKPTKEEATKLLKRLSTDENFLMQQKKKAIVWAYERTDLTLAEIGQILGFTKPYIHKIYHANKGGNQS